MYETSDFIQIIHLTDTDGVYIPDEFVKSKDESSGLCESGILYDELKDFTDEEKEKMSDDFAEKYEGKVKEFIDFISDESVAVPGTYQETWKYIEKEHNSLNRHSNMNQIFL